jgi:hypothetical protein
MNSYKCTMDRKRAAGNKIQIWRRARKPDSKGARDRNPAQRQPRAEPRGRGPIHWHKTSAERINGSKTVPTAHWGAVRVRPLVTRCGRLGGTAATLTGGHSHAGQGWPWPLLLSGALAQGRVNPVTRPEPGTRCDSV